MKHRTRLCKVCSWRGVLFAAFLAGCGGATAEGGGGVPGSGAATQGQIDGGAPVAPADAGH
jgi:hypothetical protein